MIIRGQYNLKDSSYQNLSSNTFDNESFSIASNYDVNHKIIKNVIEQYPIRKEKYFDDIDDLFLITLFDKQDSSLRIRADFTGSPFELYYTIQEDILYYSTSLKDLLLRSKIKRVLNKRSANILIENCVLVGKETLIENVYKLRPGYELYINDHQLYDQQYQIQLKDVSILEAIREYIPTLRNSINRKSNPDVSYMPLSSGYDSNFILDSLLLNHTNKIETFSVGSKTGNNEIPIVKEIIKDMDNVELHEQYVDQSYYEYIPDIIWRLEGSVLETGIYLQYALANEVVRQNGKVLICGDGNDQIQSKWFFQNMKQTINQEIKDNDRIGVGSDPFIFGCLIILKKSGIMLNSFGIEGAYPYLTKHFMEVAKPLRNLNGFRKWYFKYIVKKICDSRITNNMQRFKSGGTTGITAIISKEDLERLSNTLNELDFFKELNKEKVQMNMTEHMLKKQAESNRIAKIKQLLFHKKPVVGVSDYPIRQLFIYLFNELFITGKYDSLLEKEPISIKTSDLFHY